MEDPLIRFQKLVTRRFRELGRLYIRVEEPIYADGLEKEEKREVRKPSIGVVENPEQGEGMLRALFSFDEPYRAAVSLRDREKYRLLGEGEITERERTRARAVESNLNMRVYDPDEDKRHLPEIFPHQAAKYEGHPVILWHKRGVFEGTIVRRPFGSYDFIEIPSAEGPKVFGLGNFIGGTIMIDEVIFRLTEHGG